MQGKRTAWRHDSELAMVRDWFYLQYAAFDPYSEPSGDMRQSAVDRVSSWALQHPGVTHAVVATAALTEAILHDEQANRTHYISDSAMQSIYAMAFCRFVTGFVDRDVAKANTATLAVLAETDADVKIMTNGISGARGEISMFAHATKIRLPITFVELRHQATHGKMPGLEDLRAVTMEGLEWLYEKWWRRNATGNPEMALRALELERVEGEEARRMEMEEGRDHSNRVEDTLWDRGEGEDGRGGAVSEMADEMLCTGCQTRKRGVDDVSEEIQVIATLRR